jgi:DNA-binding GntR family transcriptional regulator
MSVEQSLLSFLRPVERRVLHETVLVQLLMAIRNGQVRPGERIREADIAERLGLSRGTVREALLRLEQDGVVVNQPHRGTYIAPITLQDAVELFSLRRVLESFAVELVVPHITDAALDDLAATVRAMVAAAEASDHAKHRQLDLQFHEQLCLLSGHRHLYKTWAALALKLWLIYFDREGRYTENPVERATAHFELIEILSRRDSAAAKAWIERHIDSRARRVIAYMKDGAKA